jgi:hypothetical protein
MRKYVDEYGIGPWKIYVFNPATRWICMNTANRSSAPGA